MLDLIILEYWFGSLSNGPLDQSSDCRFDYHGWSRIYGLVDLAAQIGKKTPPAFHTPVGSLLTAEIALWNRIDSLN